MNVMKLFINKEKDLNKAISYYSQFMQLFNDTADNKMIDKLHFLECKMLLNIDAKDNHTKIINVLCEFFESLQSMYKAQYDEQDGIVVFSYSCAFKGGDIPTKCPLVKFGEVAIDILKYVERK